jgi:hypothetical protein
MVFGPVLGGYRNMVGTIGLQPLFYAVEKKREAYYEQQQQQGERSESEVKTYSAAICGAIRQWVPLLHNPSVHHVMILTVNSILDYIIGWTMTLLPLV